MRFTAFILILGVLVLDQLTKLWLIGVMEGRNCLEAQGLPVACQPIEILPFFNLVMVWNHGVSFGMFQLDPASGPYILAGLSLVIVGLLLFWLRRAEGRLLSVALPLVIGGALGNVVDRLIYGAVADFFDAHAWGWHWPAFNVADITISIGVAGLIFDSLFGGKDRSKRPA